MSDPVITLGIEEEFFLVDPETRDLLADPDTGIFADCEEAARPHRVVREALRAQIETNTKVCGSVAELSEALKETRRVVIATAERYGAAIMASSTHPFASWATTDITPKERYRTISAMLQGLLNRLLIGGMHIHAGFGDADERIQVMTAMRRYLPLLHAMSASSPFSDGHETGFRSWRLALFSGLPRVGIPAPLWSARAYEDLLDEYRNMGFIRDGSELWWDIRPSHAYPTIEMRICDVCTRIEDAVTIAALYASLVRRLLRQAREGTLPDEPLTEIIAENRWIAQRYGVLAFFGDIEASRGRLDIADAVRALIDDLADDARALGCEDELRRATTIIDKGNSADRQVDLWRLCQVDGMDQRDAFRVVVDHVIRETRDGTGLPDQT